MDFASLNLGAYASPASALGNIATAISGYSAARTQSKSQQAWQNYTNTMARLSGAQNQNTITENELSAAKTLETQGIQMQSQDALTLAKVEAGAAAAGVAGNSVNQSILNVQANSAIAERTREQQLTDVYLKADQQSIQNAEAVNNSQDHSFIPTPNVGSFLLPALTANLKLPGLFGNDPKASRAGQDASTVTPLSSSYIPNVNPSTRRSTNPGVTGIYIQD